MKAAVAGPVPARIGGAGVANADLTRTGNGYPTCFQPADYGTNTVSFSYHHGGGPGGSGAETVTMTNRSSGDAKLLLGTDLGECSPSVSPGHSYAAGAWYKSSSPTQFDLYYRNQTGVWAYWTTGVQFPGFSDVETRVLDNPAHPGGRDRGQLRPGGRQRRAGDNLRL